MLATRPTGTNMYVYPSYRTYADMAGEELFSKYQTLIYLGASASAEFFADIALSPFEAVKVPFFNLPAQCREEWALHPGSLHVVLPSARFFVTS